MTKTLDSIVGGLADGYRRRYLARGLACVGCAAPATHGQWADNEASGELAELPLCDTCDPPEPWIAA